MKFKRSYVGWYQALKAQDGGIILSKGRLQKAVAIKLLTEKCLPK